jgi:hypothetical protein
MHPLAVAPGSHYARSTQIGEMATDLGLMSFQDFHKEAYTNFFAAHQV